MNAVSIDVDMLDQVPAKTMLKLVERTQSAKRYAELFHLTVRQFAPLFRRLEELDIDLSFGMQDGDINVSFTGDGERLKTVWAELRRNGFEPAFRPKKGETEFSTFFQQAGFSQIWFRFSSTVCKRVQVGTHMVEQPIYETRCDELPELEAPAQAVAVADEVPF